MPTRSTRSAARRRFAAGACAALALALACASARAESFAKRAPAGSEHRYRIQHRFDATVHAPESANARTRVDFGLEATFVVIARDDRRAILRLRVEGIEFRFVDDTTGGAIVGVGFDSDAPVEQDASNPSSSLREMVGRTFELLLNADGSVDNLSVFTEALPDGNTAAILGRLVNEGLLASSIEWIFGLPPAGASLEVGAAFTKPVRLSFRGDGHVDTQLRFTYAERADDDARFVVAGDAAYIDDRPPMAVLDGREVMVIDESTIEGEAAWRPEDGVLESLRLTVEARIEPVRIDPLGRRIERRTLGQSYSIQRLPSPGR